jgi:hypothetical protein
VLSDNPAAVRLLGSGSPTRQLTLPVRHVLQWLSYKKEAIGVPTCWAENRIRLRENQNAEKGEG